jgi:GxxExxY protein
MADFKHDPLTEKIIGCCFEVHRLLGPGFNEKVYSNALQYQLKIENLSFVAEKEFNVFYKEQFVGNFRCDIFVENAVIVELKSVTGILPKLFAVKVRSYLKASKIKTGLLVNFGNPSCEVKRFSV